MHEQLTEYSVNNLLFNPQQYGLGKTLSTELAALELIGRLISILIEKLAYYSVKNKARDL